VARALTLRFTFFVSCLALLAAPSLARADVQLSVRLGAGGGAAFVRDGATDGFFDMHLAADALFGPRLADSVRVGPSIELRTNDYRTAEATLGASLLLPLASGLPLVLTAALGYASRRDRGPSVVDVEDADGALGLVRAAFGYRPYDYLSPYAYGLQVYVDLRRSVTGPERWEVGAGVEVDLEFLFVIPVLFLATWLGGGDPDESDD
jgi:opacity protein-like surface antigen